MGQVRSRKVWVGVRMIKNTGGEAWNSKPPNIVLLTITYSLHTLEQWWEESAWSCLIKDPWVLVHPKTDPSTSDTTSETQATCIPSTLLFLLIISFGSRSVETGTLFEKAFTPQSATTRKVDGIARGEQQNVCVGGWVLGLPIHQAAVELVGYWKPMAAAGSISCFLLIGSFWDSHFLCETVSCRQDPPAVQDHPTTDMLVFCFNADFPWKLL